MFEPEFGGHQWEHVRYLLTWLAEGRSQLDVVLVGHPEVVDRGRVMIAGGAAEAKVRFRRLLPAEFWGVTRGALLQRALRQWSLLRRVTAEVQPFHVHVMHLDHLQLPLAAALPWCPDVTLSGLLFRPSCHYGRFGCGATPREWFRDRRKAVLYASMLRRRALTCVLTLDPYFASYARTRFARGGKVLTVPDPVPLAVSGLTARSPVAPVPIPPGRLCFVLFGALARRKGVLEILEAAEHLPPEMDPRIALLLAGKLAADVRAPVADAVARLRCRRPHLWLDVWDRFLADSELTALLKRADVVLAPYRRFVGSSGVLSWASAAGKPVLTQDYGLLGALVKENALGLAVDTRKPVEIARALTAFIQDPSALRPSPGMTTYARDRSPAQYAELTFRAMESTARVGRAG